MDTLNDVRLDLFQGFSKLSREERFSRLQQMGAISPEDLKVLKRGEVDPGLAEKFIENVIGYFQLPLGVATNFVIDGRVFVIPMAVEETSIVAAASKTAKWVKDHGSITTEVVGNEIIGQIQLAKVKDFARFEKVIRENAEQLVVVANQDVAKGLVARGGGVKSLQIRKIDRGDGFVMAVIHVLCDPCDAMGANIMNQVCEFLKQPIQDFNG